MDIDLTDKVTPLFPDLPPLPPHLAAEGTRKMRAAPPAPRSVAVPPPVPVPLSVADSGPTPLPSPLPLPDLLAPLPLPARDPVEPPTTWFERALAQPRMPVRAALATIAAGGVVALLYFAARTSAAPAPATTIIPVAMPIVVTAPPSEPHVRLPITSTPPGATVTLVSDGDITVVGQTPLELVLDPTRAYDIVVTHAGHRTSIQHVPGVAPALAIDLAPDTTAQPVRNRPRS